MTSIVDRDPVYCALSLTEFDLADAQVMASVSTTPRWRWLYLDGPTGTETV